MSKRDDPLRRSHPPSLLPDRVPSPCVPPALTEGDNVQREPWRQHDRGLRLPKLAAHGENHEEDVVGCAAEDRGRPEREPARAPGVHQPDGSLQQHGVLDDEKGRHLRPLVGRSHERLPRHFSPRFAGHGCGAWVFVVVLFQADGGKICRATVTL